MPALLVVEVEVDPVAVEVELCVPWLPEDGPALGVVEVEAEGEPPAPPFPSVDPSEQARSGSERSRSPSRFIEGGLSSGRHHSVMFGVVQRYRVP